MKQGKTLRIEEVSHGPFKLVIKMDGSNGVFFCENGSQRGSGTLPEVRLWARNALRAMCSMEWHPVMEVHSDSEDDNVNNLRNCSNIRCYIERYYIAWDGKKWIMCPWVVDAPGVHLCSGPSNSEREQDEMPTDLLMAQRIAKSREFHYGPKEDVIKWPIVSEHGMGGTYIIPYSEEHWQTMLGILDRIRELRAGINKLMSTQGGWLVLAEVAKTKLLANTSAAPASPPSAS